MIIRSSTMKADPTKEHTRHTHTHTHPTQSHTYKHTQTHTDMLHMPLIPLQLSEANEVTKEKGAKRNLFNWLRKKDTEGKARRGGGRRRGTEKGCCYCYGHFVLETIIKHKQKRQTKSARRWRSIIRERERERQQNQMKY